MPSFRQMFTFSRVFVWDKAINRFCNVQSYTFRIIAENYADISYKVSLNLWLLWGD